MLSIGRCTVELMNDAGHGKVCVPEAFFFQSSWGLAKSEK
jgi:hypothetical protein